MYSKPSTHTPLNFYDFFSNKSSSRSVFLVVFFPCFFLNLGNSGSNAGTRDHPRPWSIAIKTWRLQWLCSSAPTRCFDSNWMPLEELKSMGIFWGRRGEDYGILGWRFGKYVLFFSPIWGNDHFISFWLIFHWVETRNHQLVYILLLCHVVSSFPSLFGGFSEMKLFHELFAVPLYLKVYSFGQDLCIHTQ